MPPDFTYTLLPHAHMHMHTGSLLPCWAKLSYPPPQSFTILNQKAGVLEQLVAGGSSFSDVYIFYNTQLTSKFIASHLAFSPKCTKCESEYR